MLLFFTFQLCRTVILHIPNDSCRVFWSWNSYFTLIVSVSLWLFIFQIGSNELMNAIFEYWFYYSVDAALSLSVFNTLTSHLIHTSDFIWKSRLRITTVHLRKILNKSVKKTNPFSAQCLPLQWPTESSPGVCVPWVLVAWWWRHVAHHWLGWHSTIRWILPSILHAFKAS